VVLDQKRERGKLWFKINCKPSADLFDILFYASRLLTEDSRFFFSILPPCSFDNTALLLSYNSHQHSHHKQHD